MRVLMAVVAAAGVMGTTAVRAQVVQVPAPVGGPSVRIVSDFDGPYAAMPPAYDGPRYRYDGPRYGYTPMVLPPREITAILREAGFSPLGMPMQRGVVYTVAAIDPNGEDGRMVIDARSGRILRFMPAELMGGRMEEETRSAYGPEGGLPPAPYVRAEPPAVIKAPKLASRTPVVPLPKRAPARAVASPTKPVAPAETKPVAVAPPATPPAEAPVQQSAVTEPKPVEAKPAETPAATPPAAAPAASAPAAAPTVPAPAVEAKPAEPNKPADTPAPVQGLE